MRGARGALILMCFLRVGPRLERFSCLGRIGLVSARGFSSVFESGEVAAFVTDFSAGSFAGPSAGAVRGRLMDADSRLVPFLGFFHTVSIVLSADGANGAIYPMARPSTDRHVAVAMKLPDDQHDGGDAAESVMCGNCDLEPLFGDERWIQERLRVLKAQAGTGERRAAV